MNNSYQKQKSSLAIALATACGAASLLAGTLGASSAQASELIASASVCPKYAGGGQLEAYIETRNFSIHLCRRRGQLFYTGVSKKDGKGIRSLRAYTEEGTGYVVTNGQYEYIVNGASLDILRNGKVLQSEPVIRYVSGY
ncbi:MAG: hypothetical protein KME23_08240 [Goleter apudmare HA4340-LM2]|jgi:hypothetical protein|nr:hypothetical protein [Goleter apudmare HA4340-LM2]